MPTPDDEAIRKIVLAHLDIEIGSDGPMADLVAGFVARLEAGENLAIDQLLSAVSSRDVRSLRPRLA